MAELKRETDKFNNYFWRSQHFLVIDRTHPDQISKDVEDLNITISVLDLLHIHRRLHPKMTEYIFFWNVHRIFVKLGRYWVIKQMSINFKIHIIQNI